MRLYSGKSRALGTTCIPRRGRGINPEGKRVPVFIGPEGGKEKEGVGGFPDLNNVYSKMIDFSRNGYGRETRKESNEGAATLDWPQLWLLERFSDSFPATSIATNITNTWQWGATMGTPGQNIGRHTGSRSGQNIVHLYFSKSVKLVLLTMKSILPITGLLWPFTFCQDLSCVHMSVCVSVRVCLILSSFSPCQLLSEPTPISPPSAYSCQLL